MENNQETKALSDLIENPAELSAIITNPADSGMKFYKALHNKDKQYVAFAAGIGLIAYGLFLNRGSKKKATAYTSGKQSTGKNAAAGKTGGSTGGNANNDDTHNDNVVGGYNGGDHNGGQHNG
jgi:hypothetical protein